MSAINTEEIKSLREENGHSLAFVANYIGLRYKRSYANVEKGERGLSIQKIQKLSELYGVPFERIIKKS